MHNFQPLIKTMTYVLDDEEAILKWIALSFEEHGITNYKTFRYKRDMLEEFNEDVQICIIDYNLAEAENGVEVMKRVKKIQPLCCCIMMSKLVDEEALIDIMNAGCNRFIKKDKPNWLEKLIEHVTEAAIENDLRLRSTLQAAARIKETIDLFEKFRNNAAGKLQAFN